MKTLSVTLRAIACVAFAVTLSFCGRKGDVQDGPAIDTVHRENLPAPHPGNPVDSIPVDSVSADTARVQ